MDPKNQNLKPELKEIYDKIMSTPTGSGTPQANPAPSQTVVYPSPAPVSEPSTPPPAPTMPSVDEPTSTPSTPPPPPVTPMFDAPLPTSEASNPSVNPPEMSAPIGSPQSNLDSKGFVFSGGQTSSFTPSGSETAATPKKGLGKISGKLLTLLIIAFIITYTIIWLKLFNFF